MVQDIMPHVFNNQFCSRSAAPDDYLFIFQDDRALLCLRDGELYLPRIREFPEIAPADCRSLFSIDGEWYALLSDRNIEPPAGYAYYGTREYRKFRPMERLFPCGAAATLYRWYRANRFCGCCGAEMRDSETERARVCAACGNVVYPRINPAVIVAVRNGDRLLLTKYAGRERYRNYALIAGFAEIGETIEETVHREVLEETGLRVKNLRFYKSQPWVFTDTLLFGFFAELDGSDRITVQEDELAEANWYPRSEVPADTAHMSLTAEMIEQFRLGHV